MFLYKLPHQINLHMYFCYADESGDSGLYDVKMPEKTGSPYLIYTAIIVRDSQWRQSLNILKNFRKRIARDSFLNYDEEFHCADMIDPHKNAVYKQISVANRWKLIEDFGHAIGKEAEFHIIPIVLDKKVSKLDPSEYITTIISKMYQAYDHFLNAKKEHGIVFFDKANEKKISSHVRRLLGTGVSARVSGVSPINWILEDPIYKVSTDSLFIQSADVAAYTFKEQEFPQASRKKFQADRIFKRKFSERCYLSPIGGEDGIIRV